MKLFERVIAPSRPRGHTGDRAAAEAALGYAYPAWDVVEHYGDGRFLWWLCVPSPHVADGIESLQAQIETVTATVPGARLLAFSDPEGTFVYATADDDRVHLLVDETPHATGLTFGALIEAWLGGEVAALPPVDELTGDAAIAPFFAPDFDPARTSHIVWVDIENADTARWATALALFGGHVTMNRYRDEEGRLQEQLYLPSLEAQITFDLVSRPQLHVRFYEDRRADVRALIHAICDAAGMTITGSRGTRGIVNAL